MYNKTIEALVAELDALREREITIKNEIQNIKDGFHYRVSHSQFGHKWDSVFNNYYTAKQDALTCYCADYEGYAVLHTNNPDILNDEDTDWGDVHVEFEEC